MHNKMEQFKDMDAQLIDEVGKGNQAAFDILFSKYNNKLYASLLAFTKSQDLAEDLTQKTFIRVWKKIETFRGDSSLFTWIYRIAINLAKNEFSSSRLKIRALQIISMTLMILNRLFHPQKVMLLKQNLCKQLWISLPVCQMI